MVKTHFEKENLHYNHNKLMISKIYKINRGVIGIC